MRDLRWAAVALCAGCMEYDVPSAIEPEGVDDPAIDAFGAIGGQVCDAQGQRPASFEVWAIDADGARAAPTATTPEGRFEFEPIAAGAWTVHTVVDGIAADYAVVVAADATATVFTPSCDAAPPPLDTGIRGEVCAADGGAPDDARVWVIDGDGVVTEVAVQWDGSFAVGVDPGTWIVRIEVDGVRTEYTVVVAEGAETVLATDECTPPDPDRRVAVVRGVWDDIGAVLDRVGVAYDTYDFGAGLLDDPEALAEYDAVFLNCGMVVDPYTYTYDAGDAGPVLAEWVAAGGEVYASDYAYYVVEAAFPEMIDFAGRDTDSTDPMQGASGEVPAARVLNPALAAAIGSDRARLYYDLGAWVVPDRVGPAEILVEGDVRVGYGYDDSTHPLAVRMQVGDGDVVYTTFHNEAQTTWEMDRMLEAMALGL